MIKSVIWATKKALKIIVSGFFAAQVNCLEIIKISVSSQDCLPKSPNPHPILRHPRSSIIFIRILLFIIGARFPLFSKPFTQLLAINGQFSQVFLNMYLKHQDLNDRMSSLGSASETKDLRIPLFPNLLNHSLYAFSRYQRGMKFSFSN